MIWEGGNQKISLAHVKELRSYMDEYDPHGGRLTRTGARTNRRAIMDVCIGTEGGREVATLPVVEGEYDREESPRRVWMNFRRRILLSEAKGKSDYVETSEQ